MENRVLRLTAESPNDIISNCKRQCPNFFFSFEVWEVRFKEMTYLVGLDDEKW